MNTRAHYNRFAIEDQHPFAGESSRRRRQGFAYNSRAQEGSRFYGGYPDRY